MTFTVISVENLSKSYRLGQITGRTLTQDLNRWWSRARHQPDPYLKIGQADHAQRAGEEIWALKDVSFTVQQGEVLGIIGRNGAGKSTLLKILSRVTAPTSGVVKVKGRIASLLEVGTGFHPELTGRENVYLNGAILGMTRQEVARKFDEIVDFAEIEQFIDTPVKRYSSGMYVRLAFAVAAHLEPEILVVDEVLAVGDAEFQKKCLGKMGEVAEGGRTVLFVSHNMASIEQLCNSGIVLHKGGILYNGATNDAIFNYEKLTVLHLEGRNRETPEHILFYQDDATGTADYAITQIETLDLDEKPKSTIYTWDRFRLRIHYMAAHSIRVGSVVIKISNRQGIPISLLSTQPDSNVPLSIKAGRHFVDCEFDAFPLSSGEYIIGCGLAIPKQAWLCYNENMAILKILPKDVYYSGQLPEASRSLLALPHRWVV